MLDLKNISFGYTDKLIIDNLDLTLTPNIYGLLGANGAGKSTLMKLITLLEKPLIGSISYNGKDVYLDKSGYLKKIGYLPQQTAIFSRMKVGEYLLYFAALKNVSPINLNQKVDDLLTTVNLYNEKNEYMSNLSGGMLRRLGICNALLSDPKILILDEPLTGLDIAERGVMIDLLFGLRKEKIIMISSHITSELEAICSHIIMYRNGKVLAVDTLEALLKGIENSVWEINGDNLIEQIKVDYLGARIIRRNGILKTRFITHQNQLNFVAESCSPNLEDLFFKVQHEHIVVADRGQSV